MNWSLRNVPSLALGLALLLMAAPASAGVRLASVFGPHMVLQREMPARVWGWAAPGDEVSVEFAGQKKAATADAKGAWKVDLDPMPASAEPRALKVTSKADAKGVELSDVLVGEVWLASGQSNMGTGLGEYTRVWPEVFQQAIPQMRYFTAPYWGSYVPKDDLQPGGTWRVCETNQVAYLSATAFFFGRELQRTLKVPVGMVVPCIGGTPIESWVPREAFEAHDETREILAKWEKLLEAVPEAREKYDEHHRKWIQDTRDYYQKVYLPWQKEVAAAKAEGKTPPPQPPDMNRPPFWYMAPTSLYNALIAPLAPLSMRGVIWYQGESGSSSGVMENYRKLFMAMVPAWRKLWGRGDFPFLIVQLPYYTPVAKDPNERSEWAQIREIQRQVAEGNPNTGLAVTLDTGDDTNLHPPNKDVVGARLALLARARAYGEKVVCVGPVAKSAEAADGLVKVTFGEVGGGLVARGSDGQMSEKAPVQGFAVAGPDGKYAWAEGTISGSTVRVRCDAVPNPASVRYAWVNHPPCNLFNREGLPAGPFELKLPATKP
jgi:sialate O-acetylesterase